MLDNQDQFYVQPQQQEVRQIQELQLPTPIYEKSSQVQQRNIGLKYSFQQKRIMQMPKQTHYLYKRFKFEKKPESEPQQQDKESAVNQAESAFTEFYLPQQLVYKRYHNQNIAKFKNCHYFAGTFVHHNVFSTNQMAQSSNFQDIIKDLYDLNSAQLPQDSLKKQDLRFDSQFQSGNLFAAFKISNSQYDLVMQMDKNSRGNNQWFYFSVQNMTAGKQYTFNVVNFTKNDSLFNYGMQPATYSLIEGQKSKDPEKVWKRMGLEVSYRKGPLPRQNSRRFYYKLSFKIISKHSGDKLFIAHSYPYSYSKLNNFIYEQCQQHKDIVQKLIIGKTLSKRPIQCLKITNNSNGSSKKKDVRKAIVIMARQHPGQTQGSFVCEGVMQKILNKSRESQFLRKNYIFYVIPMVNVDGVVYGHYRTNLSGKDLNRKWDSTEKDVHCPEVKCIKGFLAQLSKQREIRFMLDLHGHSKKLNSFFYGNPCNQNPEVVRIYPFVCSKVSPAIQFYDCTFSSQQYKRKAARVYLSYLYKLLHVYTFEVSFYAYFKGGKKIQFTPKQFRDLGGSLIVGLSMQLQHQVKYQQSFDFSMGKNSVNKQFMGSPFVKILTQLRQNKTLMELGNGLTSGSDSKPEDGQINDNQIQQVKPVTKLSRPPSLIIQGEPKSAKISRKGQRQVRQMVRPVRNMRFLQISKINSVLPDKYQLCLQPIKSQTQTKMNQTLKTPLSTVTKQSSECQTQKDKQDVKYKQMKKGQIQISANLSNSVKVEFKPANSNQKRYSSVIKTLNRNNVIFKIDFMAQQTRQDKINNMKKASKSMNLKHAFSQTVISFHSQRQKQKQKIKEDMHRQQRIKNSQSFLPSVDSPEQKRWTRNNIIKYDTVRIGNKRQADIFLNGVVKKYLVEKQQPRPTQPLSIFTKALQRPESLRRK